MTRFGTVKVCLKCLEIGIRLPIENCLKTILPFYIIFYLSCSKTALTQKENSKENDVFRLTKISKIPVFNQSIKFIHCKYDKKTVTPNTSKLC